MVSTINKTPVTTAASSKKETIVVLNECVRAVDIDLLKILGIHNEYQLRLIVG